jgi:hypothetical protein
MLGLLFADPLPFVGGGVACNDGTEFGGVFGGFVDSTAGVLTVRSPGAMSGGGESTPVSIRACVGGTESPANAFGLVEGVSGTGTLSAGAGDICGTLTGPVAGVAFVSFSGGNSAGGFTFAT